MILPLTNSNLQTLIKTKTIKITTKHLQRNQINPIRVLFHTFQKTILNIYPSKSVVTLL